MSKSKKIVAALGVAAVLGGSFIPLSSYAAPNASTNATTVKVTVADSISIDLEDKSSTNGIAMEANQYIDSKHVDSGSQNQILHKIKVTTNAVKGYKLTLNDSDTTTALTNAAEATIPTISTTGSLTAGTAGWGWQKHDSNKTDGTDDTNIEGLTDITNSWNPVPASNAAGAEVRNHTAAATAQYTEPTYVRYGVATAENQAAGEYTDAVVYTATVNL